MRTAITNHQPGYTKIEKRDPVQKGSIAFDPSHGKYHQNGNVQTNKIFENTSKANN